MAKSKEPSQRQLRVGEELRHILADMFLRQDFDDVLLRQVPITVTEVDVSPDLRNARAYISPLGGSNVQQEIITMLNKRAGEFNHHIAKKMTLKFTPRLTFSGDDRFDYAEKIENLLKKI